MYLGVSRRKYCQWLRWCSFSGWARSPEILSLQIKAPCQETFKTPSTIHILFPSRDCQATVQMKASWTSSNTSSRSAEVVRSWVCIHNVSQSPLSLHLGSGKSHAAKGPKAGAQVAMRPSLLPLCGALNQWNNPSSCVSDCSHHSVTRCEVKESYFRGEVVSSCMKKTQTRTFVVTGYTEQEKSHWLNQVENISDRLHRDNT